MDLDNNEYPDVLVGAYDSNNAVFLKSAPVVHLDSQIQFLVAGKQVDLNNKNCRIRDGTSVPCVDVEVTVEYDGVGVPDTIGKFYTCYLTFFSSKKASESASIRLKTFE